MESLLQHLINAIANGTIYALVALGYTMVYGVLKLINFAHGDVMMVGVYMGYATATTMGAQAQTSFAGVLLVFTVAMVGCALIGLLIERFAYRPLREKPRLTALITAIGISFTLSYGFQLDVSPVEEGRNGIVAVLSKVFSFLPGAAPRFFPEIIEPKAWIEVGSVVIWNRQIISLAVALGLMAALQWLVFHTRFGRAMRAVSFDHRTASLMGIPTDRIIAGTFMFGSALAAGAGILYVIKDYKAEPMMGLYLGLKAFVAAVIGGIGHVPGAVLGAFLLAGVEELVVAQASSWRDAVAFAFLIVVLLVRPEGLFGRVAAEKV